MRRFRSGVSAVIVAAALPGSAVAQVVLDGGGVTLRAPAEIDCTALPVITLEGTIAAAVAGDRAGIGNAVLLMSQGIAAACPDAAALDFAGTDRDVTVTFQSRKDQGWRMPGTAGAASPAPAAGKAAPATANAAPSPAATPPADTPTATAAAVPAAAPAEPAPEAPAAPAIAPGIDFPTLAAFYGGVPTVRGHATLQPSETWTRILAARAYAERPDILADDMVALEVAQLMLSPVEFQQFAGPLSQQAGRGFQNLSVFDRRDLAERVRSQLKPYLDQRRQTGPIDVVHVAQIRLGEYSFERSAFPFQGQPQRQHQTPFWRGYRLNQMLDSVAFPTELRTSVEEARQIDEFLRARRNPTIYLGVFVTVDPRAPENLAEQRGQATPIAAPVAVRQIALFFDQELTQMLFDYTPALADRQTEIAALQTEFARTRMTGESLVKAIAAVTGDTAAVGRVVDAAARLAEQYMVDPVTARSTIEAAMARASAAPRQRLGAAMSIQPYAASQGGIPVSRLRFEAPNFAFDYVQAGVQITAFPDLSILPVSAEVGERITTAANSRGIETVVEGEVMQGSVIEQNDYLQVAATLTPRRVLIFSGGRGQPVAERELLADITLPDAPTLPAAPFATFGGAATP